VTTSGAPATWDTATHDAIRIVAQEIAARAVRQWPQWEDFPEIGEDDWREVLSELDGPHQAPDPDLYLRAYSLLTERADPAR
jgi:hypothetical protein